MNIEPPKNIEGDMAIKIIDSCIICGEKKIIVFVDDNGDNFCQECFDLPKEHPKNPDLTIARFDIHALNEKLDFLSADYSFDVDIKRTKSRVGNKSAWAVTIKSPKGNYKFSIHVEVIDNQFLFERMIGIWVSIDKNYIIDKLLIDALDEINMLKAKG